MERILKKIFVLAFLLFSFFPGFTDVPGESELLEADKLINESNYDEALRILIEYIKKYPSQFDGAQKRIRIITGRREQYNEKADELINLIVNEYLTNSLKKLSDFCIQDSIKFAELKGYQYSYYIAEFLISTYTKNDYINWLKNPELFLKELPNLDIEFEKYIVEKINIAIQNN